jgi:hypothetical protein
VCRSLQTSPIFLYNSLTPSHLISHWATSEEEEEEEEQEQEQEEEEQQQQQQQRR